MTPLDASVPNRVAAEAPFKISIRSMDSGLMSSSRDEDPPPPESTSPPPKPPPVSTRTPSMRTIGSFNCDREALPRILI